MVYGVWMIFNLCHLFGVAHNLLVRKFVYNYSNNECENYFIFQFQVDSPIRPDQFLGEKVIDEYKDHYMFISCIDYINKVKIGNFAEHSNQLWGISSVPTWTKINSGLVKMYQKELLGKFPVVQHILFGSLMQFKPVPPGKQLPSARLGMLAPN